MYSQLKEELSAKQAMLDAFLEQYPDLYITKVFPEDLVTQVFNGFYQKYNEERVNKIAYLNTEERDGIEIGNIFEDRGKFTGKQVEKHIENELAHLQDDLFYTLDKYELILKSLFLKWSKWSARHTAELMDTKYTLELEINKAETAIADYYINICSTPSMARRLPFSFHTTKSTLPAKPGLYFICSEGEVVYVGHSIDINRRVRNHEMGPSYYCGNSLECVTSELEIEQAKKLESEIIYILKPKENTYSK
jgi:predicted GIY-YIG superfamily endonuclease